VPTATVLTLGSPDFLDGVTTVALAPDTDDSIPLIARVCAAITRLAPEPPLVIVAEGRWAELLPGIALAQRAARRRVLAYVLVDPDYPAVSEGWPDARVHAVGSTGFDLSMARLRGWDTHEVTQARDLVRSISTLD